MKEKHYVYFCDDLHSVEQVMRYDDENVMRQDLELFNAQCKEQGINYLYAYEISDKTAQHLISRAKDKTMFYVKNACAWYVGEFHY